MEARVISFIRARSAWVLAATVAAAGTMPHVAAEAVENQGPGGAYSVLEIARFEVNREDYSNKEAERAGRIPEEMLDQIQRALLVELNATKPLPTVRKSAAAREEKDGVLVLEGKVVDFLTGSSLKRHFVGLGAGQQKIEVACTLKDATTGKVLGEETILDRKVAGIGGGSEEKGVRDFAEKVRDFITRSIDSRK